MPPLEIAHTALVIGRFAGLIPDCGGRPPTPGGGPPMPPTPRPGIADCASGVLRVIAVSAPGHAIVADAGAAPVLSFWL